MQLTAAQTRMQAFEALESNVLRCSRQPAILSRARGSVVLAEYGRRSVDFLSGAGSLNYGHNNHGIKAAIAEYLASDALIQGLNMTTTAQLDFMETFNSVILRERNLRFQFQLTGLTGANAIDTALEHEKSRNVRTSFHFKHGSYGMRLGAAAASGNGVYRTAIGASCAACMPHDAI